MKKNDERKYNQPLTDDKKSDDIDNDIYYVYKIWCKF